MGKTSKPCSFLVHPDFANEAVIQEWMSKGHLVHWYQEFPSVDLSSYTMILGPNAHYLTRGMEPYLEVVLRRARERLYGKGTLE